MDLSVGTKNNLTVFLPAQVCVYNDFTQKIFCGNYIFDREFFEPNHSKINNIFNNSLMEVLERGSIDDITNVLLNCKDKYIDFNNVFFCSGVINNILAHQFVDGLIKTHIDQIFFTIMLTREYKCIIIFRLLLSCLSVWVGIFPTVINFILQDMVTKNYLLLANNTLVTRVTYLFSSKKYHGIAT